MSVRFSVRFARSVYAVTVVARASSGRSIKMAGATFAMNPSGGTKLSDEQIAQVSGFVNTRSHK